MNIKDIFRKSTYQVIFDKFGSWPFSTSDIDWKTTPDLDIVLNKLSKSFISGQLVVLNSSGEIDESKQIPPIISNPNLLGDYKSMFYRFLYLEKQYGIAWFYFQKSSYFLLENDNCDIDFHRNKSIFNVTEFSELIRRFKYNENGTTRDLLNSDGVLVPIFDIGFSHDDYLSICRGKQIKEILKLSNGAIEALQGAFNRISMMLLTPKSDSNGINLVRVANMTDKDVEKNNYKFNSMFSIKKNAISVLNKSYDVLDTNPDNRKLDAPASLNWAAERICNQYDYPYKLFRGETKFDDAEFTFSTLYIQTLQPEADKLMKVICKYMKVKETVRMDYSKVLEQTVSTFQKSNNSYDNTSSDTQTQ
ncbi:MAG TPA: hypothetical protein DCS19_01295 [Flavobacterium sp.]|nr:hypothetical protein [Flavobacterium sp.]